MKGFVKLFGRGGLWALLLCGSLSAQEIRTERVRFEPGARSATLEAGITGNETVDYLINLRAGQYLNVSMATGHGATYFNIMEPEEQYVAIYNGSINGKQFEGTTAKSGDYRVRVYMMRSAARRNETANYRLEIIAGATHSPSGNQDALVPGTFYHATGQVPCRMQEGQADGLCDFGVVREGNGSGLVTVTKPDGRTRTIYFQDGKATGYDKSQADRGEFRAAREGDRYLIQIGEERYEIPEAVIFGG